MKLMKQFRYIYVNNMNVYLLSCIQLSIQEKIIVFRAFELI